MCDVTLAAAGIAAAGAVGSAAMSKSGGGGGSTQKSDNAPWIGQQGYLSQGFDVAQTNLRDAQNNSYSGAYTAGQNDLQKEGAQGLVDYARGTGTDLARGVASSAGTLLGSTNSFAQTAGSLAANGAGPAQTNAQSVLNAGANGQLGVPNQNAALQPGANQAAAAGYQGATQSMGNAGALFGQSQGNGNANIVAGAGQYVNNDILNGQIDAVNRDVSRGLREETMTGLNARAIAGGNLNSSRAGAAAAVAERGAADRMADNATTMRANAYNTGINASLTNQSQQNSLALGANSQLQAGATVGNQVQGLNEASRQFDTTSRLGAATSAGALDLQNRQLNAQTQLAANAQQGQAVGLGMQGATNSANLATGNAGMLLGAGGLQQVEEQRALDEARNQVEKPQDRRAQLLNNYWGVVGGGNYGGSVQSSNQQQLPTNYIGAGLGGASLAMGALQGGGGGNGALGASNNGGFGNAGQFQGLNNAWAGAQGYLGMNGDAAYGAGGYFGQGPFMNGFTNTYTG